VGPVFEKQNIIPNVKVMSVNNLRTPSGLGNFKLHSFKLAKFQAVKKKIEIITLLKVLRFFSLRGGGLSAMR